MEFVILVNAIVNRNSLVMIVVLVNRARITAILMDNANLEDAFAFQGTKDPHVFPPAILAKTVPALASQESASVTT